MKRVLLVIACSSLFVLGVTAAALASKPPAPPGQDPCSHGNTGKPCRPDPQPENGKDCDHHGKQGGVNEDHCKGDTQPPPPPPGCTTNCGGTTPSCVDNCGNTTTTPPTTTTTEQTTTTPAPPNKPPTKQQLKKQLKKQVQNLTPAERAHVVSKPVAGELSNTGMSLVPVSLLGLGLVGIGLALRRKIGV
jgi:hypothetical protein